MNFRISDVFLLFLCFFSENRSQTCRNGILEEFRSILAEFQPVSSRGDAFRNDFDIVCIFFREKSTREIEPLLLKVLQHDFILIYIPHVIHCTHTSPWFKKCGFILIPRKLQVQ